MTQRTFNVMAGVVFSLVALLHALRLFFGWSAAIGGWVVPVWFSVVALFAAASLAYVAFTLQRHAR